MILSRLKLRENKQDLGREGFSPRDEAFLSSIALAKEEAKSYSPLFPSKFDVDQKLTGKSVQVVLIGGFAFVALFLGVTILGSVLF